MPASGRLYPGLFATPQATIQQPTPRQPLGEVSSNVLQSRKREQPLLPPELRKNVTISKLWPSHGVLPVPCSEALPGVAVQLLLGQRMAGAVNLDLVARECLQVPAVLQHAVARMAAPNSQQATTIKRQRWTAGCNRTVSCNCQDRHPSGSGHQRSS